MSAAPPENPGGPSPGGRTVGTAAPAAARACPKCGAAVSSDLPFCGSCGARVAPALTGPSCPQCGRVNASNENFCPGCGAAMSGAAIQHSPPVHETRPLTRKVTLVLIDRQGQATHRYPLETAVTTMGRLGADLNFPDDFFLSPVHAQFIFTNGTLYVRDLGSRNGTWVYIDHPHRLSEGDQILVGSQVIRFRRLGYPGPRPPEQDQTRRLGSLTPSADIANLAQIRADGRARDVMHLSPGRNVIIGREQGDWQFPYDPSMSARHALIRSEDADFVLQDEGSRNGVAVAVRGELELSSNSRLLVGDQLLRVEIA